MFGSRSIRILFGTGVIICLLICMCISILPADQVPGQINLLKSGEYFPIFDSSLDRAQNYVEKENTANRVCYIRRPFGYIQSSDDEPVNLSIQKTFIDRVSSDRSYIRGEIKNLDDKMIDVVVVTFNLFDANGNQIGNAYASIDYLAPETVWKFSTEPIDKPDFQFERYASIYTGFLN